MTNEQIEAMQWAINGLGDPAAAELVPPHIKVALDAWGAGQPHPTGDFLRAVLTNDLQDAAERADHDNALTLAAIVKYVVHNLPATSYGSPAKYEAWLQLSRANDATKRKVAP